MSPTKLLVGATKFLVRPTKFDSADQKFRSANQTFVCLNPDHCLVGLVKNEGQSDQNFTLTQSNSYLVVPTLTKGWQRLKNFYESV